MRETPLKISSMLFSLFVFAPTLLQAADCEKPIGTLEALRGVAELKQKDVETWVSIETEATFCPGDSLHINKDSTAAVRFDEETLIRLDGGSTLTFPITKKEETSWLDLLHGAIYLLTRDPHGLEVATPFLRAGVDGTEFLVQTKGDKATAWVYEGRIHAINPYGDLILSEGEAASSGRNSAPQPLNINPVDAVQWALFYPAIIDQNLSNYGSLASDQSFKQAMSAYRKGHLIEAINRIESVPENLHNADYFNVLAGLQLSTGNIKEARSAIQSSLNSKSNNGVALALQSIIATAQNDKEMALTLASLATDLEPESPVTHISLSYAHQTHFQIDEALKSALQATELANDNALAWSRVSELYLMQGETEQSFIAANKAVKHNPNLSRTQSTLGFAYLSQYKFDRARTAFQKAIQLDQADPQPRLGAGLTNIRKGELKRGRKDLELAVILDPLNALYRSYLGKAYYEEKRHKLAGKQYDLSKHLDPNDPTPWLYDAVLNQSENAPGKALKNWQQSISLNDNRAVYRSRSLLEEDKAVRAAGLGRTYKSLGFDQLGKQEGLRSQREDPDSYASHKLLADIFQGQAGFDLAAVSEAHQAELRQPLTPIALRPQVTSAQLPILEGTGPPDPGYNEYNNLFSRDRVAFKANGIVGGLGTHSEDISAGILSGRNAVHVSHFNYETDGLKENQDLSFELNSLVLQHQLGADTKLRFEASKEKVEQGDVAQRITENNDSDFRYKSEDTAFEAGINHRLSSSESLTLALKKNERNEDISDADEDFPEEITLLGLDSDRTSFESQLIIDKENFNIVSGLQIIEKDTHYIITELDTSDPDFNPPPIGGEINSDLVSLYSYYSQSLLKDSLNLTLGVDFSHLSYQKIPRGFSRIYPKFSLLWSPVKTSRIRFAAFKTLQKQFLTEASLEPSMVNGFLQQHSELDGSEMGLLGIGIEQDLSHQLHAGISYEKLYFSFNERQNDEQILKENNALIYLYWLAFENLSFRYEVNYSNLERKISFTDDPCQRTETYHTVEVNYFPIKQLQSNLKVKQVNQNIKLLESNPFVKEDCSTSDLLLAGDSFITLDWELNYIFPKRTGNLGLLIKNITNQPFIYQDKSLRGSALGRNTIPTGFSYLPERVFYLKYSLNF